MPGMDRRWARRAQCPRAQQDLRSTRALNGRGHCIGGSPGIHAGEDVPKAVSIVIASELAPSMVDTLMIMAQDGFQGVDTSPSLQGDVPCTGHLFDRGPWAILAS